MKAYSKKENQGALHQQNIRVLAYFLYLCEGCPKGRSLEHWSAAKRQLEENLFAR